MTWPVLAEARAGAGRITPRDEGGGALFQLRRQVLAAGGVFGDLLKLAAFLGDGSLL